LLSCTTACKPKVVTVPVAIGGERIVGRVVDGILTWEPGETTTGQFLVVTKAFWVNAVLLEEKVRLLALELEKCREQKGPRP